MKLSKPVKILVGLATAWTVIYPLIFLAIWFLMAFGIFFSASLPATEAGEVSPPAMLPFGLFFGIFFMGFIAMPIYYYLYIWCEQPPAWALEPGTGPSVGVK